MLAEGGRLMLCCNNPTLSALAFDEMVRGAIPQAVLEQRLETSPGFVEKNLDAALKVMIYTLLA
ncbi:MAG: class I SAM-dependent methyltransferase, partial [Gammaproteobacteria bacterium]|nr:class I SAM-dependent methyltransferase [Gammaproteobacteria bacterium]